MSQIPGGLHVFEKETGQMYQPDDMEAFDRISQKLRDIKKHRLYGLKRSKGGDNKDAVERKSTKKQTGEFCFAFCIQRCLLFLTPIFWHCFE